MKYVKYVIFHLHYFSPRACAPRAQGNFEAIGFFYKGINTMKAF